jgi:hypothetical protein
MSTKNKLDRQRTGLVMSIITLVAGATGFVYQFMSDGTFLTILVCMVAFSGLAESSKGLDERDSQLLLQSYGTAFIYLFVAIFVAYSFELFSGLLHIAGPIIALIDGHWVGSMAAIMCVLIGIAGIRNFREING